MTKTIRDLKTHRFDSTGHAYDMTQCDEDCQDSDTLLIEYERVVGITDTWPVAVTKEHGALHAFEPDANIERWASNPVYGKPTLLPGFYRACRIAQELRYELAEPVSAYLAEVEKAQILSKLTWPSL